MAKYYIPTIKEFHIGFEYEELWKDVWTEKILNENDLNSSIDFPCVPCEINNNLQFANVKRYRVKYLDKEDIESLEWKITKDREYDLEAQWIVNDYSFYDLTYDFSDNELFIEEFYQASLIAKPTGKYNSVVRFKGVIKNISELKIILKQIGIIK